MYDDEVKDILDKLKIIDKTYDVIRLVDPIFKKVVNYKNTILSEINLNCFNFWDKNRICDNCVSIRAYNENDTFVKVEYSKDKIFMVTAIPIELSKRRIVIELMKDATNSLYLGSGEESGNHSSEIYAMIDSMNNLAFKDALTGIYNRRYINERLPIELVQAILKDQSISIIMADIDFFKKINDSYGHLIGDSTLNHFAQILSGCLTGENDWIARYGGEEFIIFLSEANMDKAVEIAEHMRKTIEDTKLTDSNINIKITASFGVFTKKPIHGDSYELFIQNADRNLYLAKQTGRNRVVH